MKINTWKKAILAGLTYAVATFVTYLLFTYLVYCLFGGENFVYKGETREFVNGISFSMIQVIGIIISTAIPVFLLRFKSSDYYIVSVFIAVVLYVIFLAVMFLGVPTDWLINSPFNSFDCVIYGVFDFPIGAFIGMLLTPIINHLINRKKDCV